MEEYIHTRTGSKVLPPLELFRLERIYQVKTGFGKLHWVSFPSCAGEEPIIG